MRNVVAFICLACALALSAADVMRVERRKPLTANVGVVSVGLDTYWKQCPGLLEDMMKKEDVFIGKLNAHSVKVSRSVSDITPPRSSSSVVHSESKRSSLRINANHGKRRVDG